MQTVFQSTAGAAKEEDIYTVDVRVKMNPLITTGLKTRKVNLMNQNITDRHGKQEEIPWKIECRDHLFIFLHYMKISHSADLRADVGLSSLMIKRPGWSDGPRTLDVF